MTKEHFIFIPTIFFLGFFFGALFSQKKEEDNKTQSKNEPNKINTSIYSLGLSFFIFMTAFITTHLLPFFGGAKALHSVLNGNPLFDQRPVFSSSEVYQRLNDIGILGREKYLQFTYTADVIFPLALLGFIFTLTNFILDRSIIPDRIKRILKFIPILWFLTDMLENTILFTLIHQFPEINLLLSGTIGYITVLKFIFLILSILSPLFLSFLWREIAHRKNK